MADLLGVVNKPQFDTEIFKIGKAIHVRKYEFNRYKSIDTDAIISNSTPLEIVVEYYWLDSKEVKYKTLPIKIEDIVKENIKLTNLKEDK